MCSLQQRPVFKSYYTHIFQFENGTTVKDAKTPEQTGRKKGEGTIVSQHALLWEKATPTSASHAQPRANMPSFIMGDLSAKVSASRQKFSQNASASSTTLETGSKQKAAGSESAVDGSTKRVNRNRTDFSQLLQKFSGSEASGSDKSDCEGTATSGLARRALIRRQEAKVVSSGSDSDAIFRRTPERTQSLRTSRDESRSSASPSKDTRGVAKGVEKSSSFKSEFMTRRRTQNSPASTPAASSSTDNSTRPRERTSSNNASDSDSSVKNIDSKLDYRVTLPDTRENLSSVSVTSSHDGQQPDPTPINEDSGKIQTIQSLQTSIASTSHSADDRLPTRIVPEPFSEVEQSDLTFSSTQNQSITHQTSESGGKISVLSLSSSAAAATTLTAATTTTTAASSSIAVAASTQSPVSPTSSATMNKVMWTSTPSLWAAENPAMSATGQTAETGSSSGTEATPGSTPRAGSSGIRRATSFRDVSNQLSSPEHPGPRKGILKRATSLSSKDVSGGGNSSPLLDPQLAKILQQRRQIQGDVDEEEEENDENEIVDENLVTSPRRRRSRAISAADEIEETLRYSQEKAAERGIDPDRDEALRRTSVAERIFSMQTKIEENKVSPTSGSRSSLTSPRSRSRSGLTSPSQHRSLSQEDATSPTQDTSMSSTEVFLSQSLSSSAATPAAATTATISSSSSTVSSSHAPSPSSSSNKTCVTAVPSTSTPTSTSHVSSLSQSDTIISTLSSSITTATQSQSSPSFSSSSSSSFTHTTPSSAAEHLMSSSSSSKLATLAAPSSSEDVERPVAMATDNGLASNTSNVMSSPQLLEKLTKIADASDAYQERRQKFATRGRDDWRRQSQPVTLEEIEAADSLETVNAFRSLIRKQTSINVFDQLQVQGQAKPSVAQTSPKKAEGFPQHIAPSTKLNRRSRKNRHKTLPVTAEELSAVPENTILANESRWSAGDTQGTNATNHESKHDSGILSGSDVDSLLDGSSHNSDSLRSLTLEMDVGENDPSMMSVSAKASMFKSLDEKTKQDKSASGAKRYINRKKRERSQTMPITEDEVKTAAEIGDGKGSGAQGSRVPVTNLPQPEVVNRSKAVGEGQEADQEVQDDELTKLSLSDKVKLFSQRPDKDKESAKTETRVVRRRSRKQASRFNTQPVTTEEVEKAAAYSRISPLAMSMVKPPDPEILKGLPLKDQRQLMAQHAEMCLSQTSSRSHSRSGSLTSLSQPSSRRDSLAVEQEEQNAPSRSTTKDLQGVQSILKADTSSKLSASETEIPSILKQSTDSTSSNASPITSSSATSEPRGILKKIKSEDVSADEAAEDSTKKGILRTSAYSSDEGESQFSRSRSNSQPSSILKPERRSSGSGVPGASSPPSKPRGILKAPSQETVDEPTVNVKSAMRTEVSSTDLVSSPGPKSALKHGNDTVDTGTTGNGEIVQENTADKKESSSEVEDKASLSSDKLAPDLDTDKKKEGKENDRRRDESIISSDDAGASSGGEILEDTPTSTRSHRRSRFADRKGKAERYRTQPPESLPELTPSAEPEPGPRRKHKYEGRNKTQPITDGERRDAETSKSATMSSSTTPGGSISDRLNQLKTSGEENWRKRVGKKDDIVTPAEKVKLREAKTESIPRPSSIADRLNELQSSQKTWKDRVVEENDAGQFTPSNKMTTTCQPESPLLSKLKSKQKAEEQSTTSPATSPLNPSKEFISKIPLPKEIIQDTSVPVESTPENGKASRRIITPAGSLDEGENHQVVNVAVPKIGDDLEDFFATKSIHDIHDKVDVEIDDFNDIFIQAEMILPTTRKPRPVRKTKSCHVNPLKKLSQTIELKEEYTQQSLGTAEKEFKRIKKEHLAKDAGFAQAALAGLASKENFKQVELRRSDSNSSAHGQRLDPFKEVMLLHIKGRRMVQTRLVRPHSCSLNAGDCFILVTSDKVIHWEGQYANVIEKAKASEIASFIQQKKDLGCKKAGEVQSVYQCKDHLGAGKLFWAALEGSKQVQDCGPEAEDELYESSIVRSNMVYRLEGNALRPYEEYWGVSPKYEMLKKNEVIVFDFGTEFYLWQGKTVTMEQRKLGLRLAKQLYGKGYDYTESVINPFSPLTHDDKDAPAKATVRPDWSIFGKVNQNMETILFREKFSDWPDSSRIIQCKGHESNDNVNKELQELQPFDTKRMIAPNRTPVTLKLEGADVGRGVKWSEDMQGFIKQQDIITLDVAAWHVLEYEHFKLPVESHGQFHDGDTYVVRWQYMISNANLKSLKGSAARNSLTGRERCAYFFWQGKNSTINEKGASALMTVELDEERGPQVRVIEGKEPPCFLNLFGGKMVLHIGKREEPESNTQGPWRLYCLRGEFENEMYLMEVTVTVENLRSRSSLVLLNVNTGATYVWHGVKSPKHTRLLCRKIMENLRKNIPLELGVNENAGIVITEVEEGDESREMWDALGGRDRKAYNSLIQDPYSYTHTMRLFHMSSVNMVFEVHEQLNPCRTNELTVPFPFLQSDLYHAIQPALFLLDCDQCVYLWQGWWPTASKDQENVHTGSATARFNMDRQLAMETTLNYCKEKNPDKPPEAFVVCAGVEPMSVVSLFPHWEVNTAVQELAQEDGKSPGYMETVAEVLHRLTQTRYTLAELQERPLPDGVDPLKLEAFLHDEEFEKHLEMSREEFYSHPAWKQLQLKQTIGLF